MTTNDDSIRQAIATRLRLARENAGLSQGQVAKKFGWHRPTLSEVEAGRRRVSAEELASMARLYGVATSWVLGEETELEAVTDRARLAARQLGKLNDNDLDTLLELIRSLRMSEDSRE